MERLNEHKNWQAFNEKNWIIYRSWNWPKIRHFKNQDRWCFTARKKLNSRVCFAQIKSHWWYIHLHRFLDNTLLRGSVRYLPIPRSSFPSVRGSVLWYCSPMAAVFEMSVSCSSSTPWELMVLSWSLTWSNFMFFIWPMRILNTLQTLISKFVLGDIKSIMGSIPSRLALITVSIGVLAQIWRWNGLRRVLDRWHFSIYSSIHLVHEYSSREFPESNSA